MLDLFIVALLVSADINYNVAIVVGYIIGVSLNYAACHHVVYRGTEQTFWRGYFIFMCLAAIGMLLILGVVNAILYFTDWNLLIVRTLAAAIVGFCGFIINTFFNFRLL